MRRVTSAGTFIRPMLGLQAGRLPGLRRCLLTLAVCCGLVATLGGMADSPTSDEAAPDNAAATADAEKDGAAAEAPETLPASKKLLPDQKAYIGAPPTVIDLGVVIAETEIAESGGPLTWEVLDNTKDKYCGASIDGDQLRLDWKEEVGKTEIRIRCANSQGEAIDVKFTAEVWEADWMRLLMAVVGGLGVFLLGMKNLSDGMQAVAGSGLRRMISMVTDNRLMAVGVGALVTATIQSSSITTVMVVGFVNSGFMTLSQAVGVIMGANIGTTITGWILAMKIGKYGLLLLGLGAFGYQFTKQERWRFICMSVMGLGMVFFGLEMMKDGFAFLKDMPQFEAWFKAFRADDYPGVLKCAAVGCVLTFIVQSSSATLGITIGLAQIGVIEFETGAALVMGENVGTTITAWLASFGATTAAKRAAYFHALFNLLGVLWITAIFLTVYLQIITSVSAWFGITPETNMAGAIAAVHTGFNVTNCIIFLPLAGVLANFLERVVPDRKVKEEPRLTHLEVRLLESPAIAVEQSRVEVLHMGEECIHMLDWVKQIIASDPPDPKLVQSTFHREEVLDTVQDEIVAFMTNLLSGNAPTDVVNEGRRQLRMADEYESVSDYIATILKSHLKLDNAGLRISDRSRQELDEIHEMVAEYVELIAKGYERRQGDVITMAKTQGEAITLRVKKSRDDFVLRMTEEKIAPHVSVGFNSQLNAYRRIRDHILNVAEAMVGEK